MSTRGRHAAKGRSRALGSARVTIPIVLGVLLLAGGGVYAAHRYDASTQDRILPGVTVAGVDVGGMTRRDAIQAVKAEVNADLDQQIQVEVAGESWAISPAKLGTRSDFRQMVDQALAVNQDYSWIERAYHRLLDRPVDASLDVSYSYNEDRIRRFVETIAGAVDVSPTNAQVDFVDGELVLHRPEKGKELRLRYAEESLMAALASGSSDVRFDMRTLEPQITTQELGYTIVVRLSELKLHLYKGLNLVKTYPVAAGQPAYPTPQGEWTIVNKVENPTWVNPAPDGWGADMPATIGPGPGNPLGTHALYLDAPGIRIHGTYDSGSIGTFASHGCVRMYIEDVQELFGTVPIGTQVHIV
jgi:L,D-transpeptidase catalytic domain/Putative peptidoglycan binding domain